MRRCADEIGAAVDVALALPSSAEIAALNERRRAKHERMAEQQRQLRRQLRPQTGAPTDDAFAAAAAADGTTHAQSASSWSSTQQSES